MQVAAGNGHSLLLAEGGALLSCGFGGSGRLGHGDAEKKLFAFLTTSI